MYSYEYHTEWFTVFEKDHQTLTRDQSEKLKFKVQDLLYESFSKIFNTK